MKTATIAITIGALAILVVFPPETAAKIFLAPLFAAALIVCAVAILLALSDLYKFFKHDESVTWVHWTFATVGLLAFIGLILMFV